MKKIDVHVPMSGEELGVVLSEILTAVARGNSFEGSIEYLMPGPLAREFPCPMDTDGDGGCGFRVCSFCGPQSWQQRMERAEFAVKAAYRLGNREGQGGVRLIRETLERPE